MQLCGSIIIMLGDSATQQHQRQKKKERNRESTLNCICFVEKSNFICHNASVFLVSLSRLNVYIFIFLRFAFAVAFALHCFASMPFRQNKCKPLKNCDMLQHALWASACVYVKSTNVRLFKKEKWFEMQWNKNKTTAAKMKKSKKQSKKNKKNGKNYRCLNVYCGWNSLESAATYEVKIKIYVLL